jgi:hypothetical protein
LPKGRYIGPSTRDYGIAAVVVLALAVAVGWAFVFAVRNEGDIDREKFHAEERTQRRRDSAERCIAGRVDQIVRVSMPITTPTPPTAARPAKQRPKHYTPTTVTLDCEDSKLVQ